MGRYKTRKRNPGIAERNRGNCGIVETEKRIKRGTGDKTLKTSFPQTFLTNRSKHRIYLRKIPTVITETFSELCDCRYALHTFNILNWLFALEKTHP